jgi:hypothetical protein
VPPADLRDLSDRDLGLYAHDVFHRISALEAQIESPASRRKRTVKIVRSTILMSGGLMAASFVDLLALILTLLGIWDCIEALQDDAAAMNRQLELRRTIRGLESELTAIEAEFERRGIGL